MSLAGLFFKSQLHKNSKLAYYLRCALRQLQPTVMFRMQLSRRLKKTCKYDKAYLDYRVNYYNKLCHGLWIPDQLQPLSKFKMPKKVRVYYFDTFEYVRYFDWRMRLNTLFGDITNVPEKPAIVKSRPIAGNNTNSVVLKLDKVRHFTFVEDTRRFEDKKDMLIGRGHYTQEHRQRFVQLYRNHPLCNVGMINLNPEHPEWRAPKITIDEHLDYKFILCLEGNDVASNLKWVMSSNSLAVTTRPKYETWFMEGTLIPNYHYVLIKDDYSDLEERLSYYINHPEEAKQIAANANAYVNQFRNEKRESLISLLVLEKYFKATGQMA